ncbi:MAG: methyl-accepting chemotaxis protein [Myxococcaceae bacterium]|nr:methyl-accepting chemotaxis protein [Myxococcaceae bacterium]
MSSGWGDLARRAAMALRPGLGQTAETASVAFVAIDGSRGAVHAVVEGGVSANEAQRFAARFSEVCHDDGRPMRVVSVYRSVGAPLELQPVPVTEGVSLAIDALEGDGSLVRRLHIARSIAAAQKLAETSVLDVGQHMRGIFELARAHSGSLEGLVGQYSQANAGRDTIASTIESLGSKVDRVNEELVERVSRQAKSLERARAWTHDIVRLGQSIAAIASSARMLTFNARIESARIGEAGKGFAVIAQSIQDLATQIRETNDAVGSLASNLARALPELGNEAQAMASDAKDQLAQLTANLQKVRAQLDATREEAHASLVASTENATQLEQRANGVIEKLQFQDRTNQMLEEARVQTEALLKLVGVDESTVDQAVVEQVGWLGKQLEGSAKLKEAGSVELF